MLFSDSLSDFHAEISSFDSENVHLGNTAASFKTQFAANVRLQGVWKVGLTEITIVASETETSLKGSEIFVYADIVDVTRVGCDIKPLLRKVYLGKGILRRDNACVYNCRFTDSSSYKPVSKRFFSSVEIYIKNEREKYAFLSPNTSVSIT